MSKNELIAVIAEQSGLTQKQAKAALEATLDSIAAELGAGNRVVLTGFGTFEVRDRKARSGVNPNSGKAIKIPAKRVAAFKAGTELRAALA